MPVNSIVNEIKTYFKQTLKSDSSDNFDILLASTDKPQKQKNSTVGSLPNNNLIEIGTISKQHPTVSELLKSNDNYKDTLWPIILSDLNKDKQFTKMLPGTKVSLDTQTSELIWDNKRTIKKTHEFDVPKDSKSPSLNNASLSTNNGSPVVVGKISDQSPTVSDLLKNHIDYQDGLWPIIQSDINKEKQFTGVTPGTVVSINPRTDELLFDPPIKKIKTSKDITFVNDNNMLNQVSTDSSKQPISTGNGIEDIIFLGTITKETPTVSHVLKENNKIIGNYWNIIKEPINNNKPFSYLRPGTTISINKNTKELNFNLKDLKFSSLNQQIKLDTTEKQSSGINNPIIQKTESFSDNLVNSVKSYIGKPYNEIDCYGLVVRGIEGQGIKYLGKDGLQQQLESMAKMNGLPANSYFTGEGLVNSHGTTLYSKTLYSIDNSRLQAKEIYSELEDQLENGLILSFSTPSRGHTGVIAQNENSWSYINSGLIDHNVNTNARVSRKVGEEVLSDEIRNWCRLAKKHGESLRITVGRLSEEKLKRYSSQSSDFSKISHI